MYSTIEDMNNNHLLLTKNNIVHFFKGIVSTQIISSHLYKKNNFRLLCSWKDSQIKRLIIHLLSEKILNVYYEKILLLLI